MRLRLAALLAALTVSTLSAGCGARRRSAYALDYAFPTTVDVPVKRTRLANGLEVILHEDHAVPLVAVSLWYHVGSKDEPRGRAGMAHLVEHLAFDGTKHAPEGKHFDLLGRAGGRNINATTWFDHTAYFETVPPSALDLALWLEAERMAFFGDRLTDATLDRERNVVLNEMRQKWENAQAGMVGALVNAAVFPEGHPYHHTPIGDAGELAKVTLSDIRAFHDAYYVPANATLALVGDFDSTGALASIERTLGKVAASPRPNVIENPAPVVLDGEKRIVIEADVDRPRIVVAWPVMPRYARGWTELEVGADSLEGATAYGLMKESELAEWVDASLEGRQLASLLTVTARLKPGVSPDKALAQIHRWVDIARAPRTNFDRTRFAIRRASLLMGGVYGIEELSERAERLNFYNEYAGEPNYAGVELAARRGVLVEEVRDALYEFVPLDDRVVAFVVPDPKAPRSGRLAKGAP